MAQALHLGYNRKKNACNSYQTSNLFNEHIEWEDQLQQENMQFKVMALYKDQQQKVLHKMTEDLTKYFPILPDLPWLMRILSYHLCPD